MKKSSLWSLILLLPVLAALTGLMVLPAACLAQANLSAVMSLDKGPVIQAGDSVTVTLTPSGGRPPYTYSYTMYIYEHDEAYYYASRFVPDSSHTWTIGFGDSVRLFSSVLDADGREAAHEATLTVQGGLYHDPLTISGESLSPGDVINVGETITYSVIAQGGQPPYSYSYKLELVQFDHSESNCWSVPVYIDDYSCSSNSFSYTLTRGNQGYFSCSVQDAAGRVAHSDLPLTFTILGDEHAPMILKATQSVKTLTTNSIFGNNKYRMSISASVNGGTPPVTFYCLWRQYKNSALINQVFRKSGDGKFTLDGNLNEVEALVWVIDADGWESRYIRLTFDPSTNKKPFPFDWFKTKPWGFSLKENLLNPNRRILEKQLDKFDGADSIPAPILNALIPELVQLELIKPGVTEPATEGPKTVQPGLLQPLTTTIPPALKLPSPPKP